MFQNRETNETVWLNAMSGMDSESEWGYNREY